MEKNNFPFKYQKEDIIDYEVYYLNNDLITNDHINCLYLVDENNVDILNNSELLYDLNIASLSTVDELSINYDININNFILINYGRIYLDNILEYKSLIISNKDTPLTNAISKSFASKISEDELQIDCNNSEIKASDRTIIYNGNKPFVLHALLNSKSKLSVKNINHSLFLSMTRLAYNFDKNTFKLLTESISNNNNRLRVLINEIRNHKRIDHFSEFVSLEDQFDKNFQNHLNKIRSDCYYLNKYLSEYNLVIEYFIILNLCSFFTNKETFKDIITIVYDKIFEDLIFCKENINLNINILHRLFIFNSDAFINSCKKYENDLLNEKINQIFRNHLTWYLSSIHIQNIITDFSASQTFISFYIKELMSMINSENPSKDNDNSTQLLLLNIHYSNLVFDKSISDYENYSLLNLVKMFPDLKQEPIYFRINLLTDLLLNKEINVNNFDTRIYGGTESIRNLQYQFLFIRLSTKVCILNKHEFDFFKKYTLKNSFDVIFKICTIIIFQNNEIPNKNISLFENDNPWFTGNVFYNLIFHHFIFSSIDNKTGLEVTNKISRITKFSLPSFTHCKKNLKFLDNAIKSALNYTIEYYNFISFPKV